MRSYLPLTITSYQLSVMSGTTYDLSLYQAAVMALCSFVMPQLSACGLCTHATAHLLVTCTCMPALWMLNTALTGWHRRLTWCKADAGPGCAAPAPTPPANSSIWPQQKSRYFCIDTCSSSSSNSNSSSSSSNSSCMRCLCIEERPTTAVAEKAVT